MPAIWRYLEETHPSIPLMGSSAEEKAQIVMWERRAELEGFTAVMEGVRNRVAGLKGRAIAGPYDYAQIPELVQRSLLRVNNFYTDFNQRLLESPFVGGASFSVADITTLVSIDFAAKGFGVPMPEGLRALHQWYAQATARPCASA